VNDAIAILQSCGLSLLMFGAILILAVIAAVKES